MEIGQVPIWKQCSLPCAELLQLVVDVVNTSSHYEPPKKRPKKQPKAEKSDDEKEDGTVPLKACLYVKWPLPPTVPARGHSKGKPMQEYLEKGPYKFSSGDDFNTFLTLIARLLLCPKSNIAVDTLKAKPDHPGNAKTMKMNTETGYETIMEKVVALKPHQRIMHVYMVPLLKPIDVTPFWDTGVKKEEPSFDYSKLDVLDIDSILEKVRSFNASVETQKAEWYNKGNFPLIDTSKCIFYDTAGNHYFDLNQSRIAIWAKAIMRIHLADGKTDVTTPPWDSRFFDDNQKMQYTGLHPMDVASNAWAVVHTAT
ncbi:hypothetical protein GGX14DRAFT_565702 [Mycena pura]|uniref:Uncharacterized protein n=1 Tax=Mycena pura TaxID=153505 RepID=A0AAD6VFI0_9AGAR|nr:hypothetical protein GGX14DRAFT_565702 [Mycena pura]